LQFYLELAQSLMTNNNIKFLLTSEEPDLKDFDNL